jgi:adenylate kinase family enzyme/hemoglobin-like flavoprotein
LTDQDIELIRSSWSSIVSGTSAFTGSVKEGSSSSPDNIPDDATSANHPLGFFFETFYGKLFADYPHVKPLFKNATVVQGRALVKMIATAVNLVKDMDQLTPVLVDLAQRHVKYGAIASNYGPVGEVLLYSLEKCAGADTWTEAVRKAWLTAFSVIVSIMVPVAIKQEREENKTKNAEVTVKAATTTAKAMVPAPASKIDAKDLSLVFVLGGPGSGKGTNCERISKEFGYKHLSTGDLLRDEVKSGSDLGKELNEIMQTGALVPGETVLKILRNAMTEGGTKPISGRYLIDGYPRAMDQVTGFESAICKPTFVLAFDAAESVLEERLVNRGKTSGRADDNVESIRKRFATFKAQSEPVITTYSAQGLVKSLNSERPVDEVYADVRPIFMEELRRMSGPAVPTPSGLSLVFVLGGPGSGKGTNCERISKEFGYKHLSSGDLLRDEVKSGSELGVKLNAIMQTGALVPGETVLKILRNAMTEGDTKPIAGRYLIDGYPRALDQVVAFEAAICKPSLVLAFDAAESVLEERLVNRGKTSGRADDNVESIRKRFATFKAQSEPVIQVYSKEGLVKSLNSERPVDEVYADVRPIFEAEIAAHAPTSE